MAEASSHLVSSRQSSGSVLSRASLDVFLIDSTEQLQNLVETNVWMMEPALMFDICVRWQQIKDLPRNQEFAFIATQDFWTSVENHINETLDDTPPNSPPPTSLRD